MNRQQFEHAIRAAGAVLGIDEVLVIGSQAIHGSVAHEFPEAQQSIEVGIASLEDDAARKADLIDGSIGELSMFQETFGTTPGASYLKQPCCLVGGASVSLRTAQPALAGLPPIALNPMTCGSRKWLPADPKAGLSAMH